MYLSYVESICISLQGICGVWQIVVQSSLLQHLLVPILVVLTMGSETTVVAPVFFNGNLKMSRQRGEFHTTLYHFVTIIIYHDSISAAVKRFFVLKLDSGKKKQSNLRLSIQIVIRNISGPEDSVTGCRVEKEGQDWKPYSEAKRVRGKARQSQQSAM